MDRLPPKVLGSTAGLGGVNIHDSQYWLVQNITDRNEAGQTEKSTSGAAICDYGHRPGSLFPLLTLCWTVQSLSPSYLKAINWLAPATFEISSPSKHLHPKSFQTAASKKERSYILLWEMWFFFPRSHIKLREYKIKKIPILSRIEGQICFLSF